MSTIAEVTFKIPDVVDETIQHLDALSIVTTSRVNKDLHKRLDPVSKFFKVSQSQETFPRFNNEKFKPIQAIILKLLEQGPLYIAIAIHLAEGARPREDTAPSSQLLLGICNEIIDKDPARGVQMMVNISPNETNYFLLKKKLFPPLMKSENCAEELFKYADLTHKTREAQLREDPTNREIWISARSWDTLNQFLRCAIKQLIKSDQGLNESIKFISVLDENYKEKRFYSLFTYTYEVWSDCSRRISLIVSIIERLIELNRYQDAATLFYEKIYPVTQKPGRPKGSNTDYWKSEIVRWLSDDQKIATDAAFEAIKYQ